MKKDRAKLKDNGSKTKDGIRKEIRVEVGQRVAELRRKRKLSARLVGEKLDITREAITHIENGRNNINAVALWELGTIFNCDIRDFFPDVPDGYALTKVDIDNVSKEGGPKAVRWADELFGKKK